MLFSLVLLLAFLGSPSLQASLPARFAIAPESGGVLLEDVLLEAKDELLINVYKFESQEIAALLANRIRDGLTVRLLVEGQPVAGLTDEGRQVLGMIQSAMKKAKNPKNRVFVMRRLSSQKRRFRWNHAKYVVIDQKRVFITSENFNQTGLPLHPNPGVVGNRGWATAIASKALAKDLAKIFKEDTNSSYSDIEILYPSGSRDEIIQAPVPTEKPLPNEEPSSGVDSRTHVIQGNVDDAELITSPQSLADLRKILSGADQRVALQYMSITPTWRNEDFDKVVNPYVSELISVAQRGVQLRVLLNDERTFLPDGKIPPGFRGANDDTADILRKAAFCQNLPLEVKIIDPQQVNITYIHNKGILVDDDEVLVSSINGTQTSMTKNREVAVHFESREANEYYSKTFNHDWSISPNLPPWSEDEVRHLRMVCPGAPGSIRVEGLSLVNYLFY